MREDNQFEAFAGAHGQGFAPRGASRVGSPARATSAEIRLAPEPSVHARLAAVIGAQNPLLEAAQPLLRALADMPSTLSEDGVRVFHRLLLQEATTFQTLCSGAKIRHEHVVAASYALCTALDEAANSTQWGGAKGEEVGVWAGQQLAAHFHGDTKGGDKFFLLVGRLAASPQEHTDLLEVLYQILGLGFEGRFGTATNGRRQLETIRHRLLTLLSSARGDVPRNLSPHWKGEGAGKFRLLRSVPVWVTVATLALILFGLFAWYKYQLVHISRALEQRIAAIGAMRPPPAPALKPLRLKELLSAEIARGTVSVEEDDRHSVVTFRGDDMFVPGQARLSVAILPVLAKVAAEINQVSGAVQVMGHSDSQPIRTRDYPNNLVLSEKRAAAAAQVLQDKGVAASRLKIEGRGDTVPLADNATAAGRSRNRRVDIIVKQGSTPLEVGPTRSASAPASLPAPAASNAQPARNTGR